MEVFENLLRSKIISSLKEDGDRNFVYPYLNKLAGFLNIDLNDMYDFMGESLAYTSMEELEKAKEDGEIEDKEYEIHKKFFETFGKDEFELTDEDLSKFDSNREEYDSAHNDLI